jgi:hypothetical protein
VHQEAGTALPGAQASAAQIAAELSPVYREYVTTVSTLRWSISLELATFLSFLSG